MKVICKDCRHKGRWDKFQVCDLYKKMVEADEERECKGFEPKVYTPEKYEDEWLNGYNFAKLIIPFLKLVFPIYSVLDIGCGAGGFLKACKELGAKDIRGIDGGHVLPHLKISHREFMVYNLEKELNFEKPLFRYSLIVSLEVAEHIKNHDALMRSFDEYTDNALFSAAQPGQPGENHINCQPLEYWIDRFSLLGFKHMEGFTNIIRQSEQVPGWYRKNTMLFMRG